MALPLPADNPALRAFLLVALRARALAAGDILDTAALDRYLFTRNAYVQRRRSLVFDGSPPAEPEDE